eukprot:8527319-Pyramimonas_sp.AAC.1
MPSPWPAPRAGGLRSTAQRRRRLGALLECVRAVFEVSWAVFGGGPSGSPEAILEASWAFWGRSLGPLGPS